MPEYHIVIVKYDQVAQGENRRIDRYGDYNAALARFHTEMNDLITNANYSHGFVMIVNDYGVVNKVEYWEETATPSV